MTLFQVGELFFIYPVMFLNSFWWFNFGGWCWCHKQLPFGHGWNSSHKNADFSFFFGGGGMRFTTLYTSELQYILQMKILMATCLSYSWWFNFKWHTTTEIFPRDHFVAHQMIGTLFFSDDLVDLPHLMEWHGYMIYDSLFKTISGDFTKWRRLWWWWICFFWDSWRYTPNKPNITG